jgi:acyl-CoA reductase-like NAD-dependent aldehyde dehydrogenase
LIHYFGGSSRVGELLRTTFESGKALIADGEGNAWVYVDESANVEAAAELLTAGSTRYGGRTCTSINGAIIHPAVYEAVADRLVTRFQQLSPVLFEDPAEALAAMARATESGGKVLTGGHPHASEAPPTLVANPDEASMLVRQGVFGPVLWICAGDAVEFRRRWPRNRFPLCAAVIAREVDVDSWASLGNLARLVVNGDPSLEDPIEPWGGYPSTGNNPVSGWYEKYRRSVQVDSP